MSTPDNIPRFSDHWSAGQFAAPAAPMSAAEIEAEQTAFLERWERALPVARAAVAQEVARINSEHREQGK